MSWEISLFPIYMFIIFFNSVNTHSGIAQCWVFQGKQRGSQYPRELPSSPVEIQGIPQSLPVKIGRMKVQTPTQMLVDQQKRNEVLGKGNNVSWKWGL